MKKDVGYTGDVDDIEPRRAGYNMMYNTMLRLFYYYVRIYLPSHRLFPLASSFHPLAND